MGMIVSILLFILGLGLVIYFAEKLVKGAVGRRRDRPRLWKIHAMSKKR